MWQLISDSSMDPDMGVALETLTGNIVEYDGITPFALRLNCF